MEQHRKTFFIAAGVCLGLFVGGLTVGASAQDEKQFQGFNLQGYDDAGEKSWDVNGETADVVGSEIKLKNVDANMYGKNKVNLTAENGTFDQMKGTLALEKDVVITREDGAQLTTDSLDWWRDDDLVTTEDNVFITDEGYTVTGKGMKAKPGLKNAQINKDVTVRVDTTPKAPESKIVTITSDGPMTIDQDKLVATFEKNVVAIQEDRTLKADRMEVYFNKEMSDIQEIYCIGNVEITQGENKSFADKAVYNAKNQKLVLSGRPKLIMVTEGEGAVTSLRD